MSEPKTRQQIIDDAREVPIPRRWKPVEPRKPERAFDLAPFFKDWVSCPHCEKGYIVTKIQKNGYSIKDVKSCPHCHGQGGWHSNIKAELQPNCGSKTK